MTSESIAYWGAALLPPVASFALNWIARGTAALKSSGADWLLILFAFDVTGLFTLSDLAKHVVHPELKASLASILVFALIASLVLWSLVVIRLEKYQNSTSAGALDFLLKTASYAFVWMLIFILFAAHIVLFTLQPQT